MINNRLELTWYNKDKALIPTENGKYDYKWVEPSDPRYCETHTLIFEDYIEGKQDAKTETMEYSDIANLDPQSDNLLILGESGDLLDALIKVPELAEKYLGKVKLVYIDPPFNTSKIFASYEDNLEHSIWLTMMRDRLINLKKLLSEDGSIWVHLDNSENHRMRILLDEVFGSNNFVAEVVWQKADSPRGDTERVSIDHDTILCYSKSKETKFNRMDRTAEDNARFSNPDKDPLGIWWSADLTAPGNISGTMQHPAVYAIQHPITGEKHYPAMGRHWNYGLERIMASLEEFGIYEQSQADVETRVKSSGISHHQIREDVYDLVISPQNLEASKTKALNRIRDGNWPEFFVTENGFGRKSYPPKHGQPARTWWSHEEVGHNREAKSEQKALFPGKEVFSTPKPERLIERILHIGSEPGDIVLDSFAGSGTTAAVAQKMGRRWVTCELIEDNFDTYTKPRLEKVVKNQDSGGITRKEVRTLKDNVSLPEGFTTKELFRSTQLLNKLSREEDITENQRQAIREIKRMIATGPSKTLNWRGGGGFQVARISPSCFNYDPELDRVILTDQATGQVLIESVAANIGYSLIDKNQNSLFDAKKGRSYLKVYEGIADNYLIDSLITDLDEEDSLVLATTSLVDGVREYLRKIRKGSRIIHLPDGIFRYSEEGRIE